MSGCVKDQRLRYKLKRGREPETCAKGAPLRAKWKDVQTGRLHCLYKVLWIILTFVCYGLKCRVSSHFTNVGKINSLSKEVKMLRDKYLMLHLMNFNEFCKYILLLNFTPTKCFKQAERPCGFLIVYQLSMKRAHSAGSVQSRRGEGYRQREAKGI